MYARYRSLLRWLLCLIVPAIVVVLLQDELLGRAGGGGGYGGGGGGGSGGGGGGGGGGEAIAWLIYLCIRHPKIGIPLLIVVVVLMYFGGQQGHSEHQGRVIRRGNRMLSQHSRGQAVAQLQSDDPAFQEAGFRSRVQSGFLKIQQAWSDQLLDSVRAFVSDGIYERFLLQILEQKDLGYRNVMESVVVQQVILASVQRDEFFDMVSVRICASAKDYRIHLDTGRQMGGSMRPESFVEYWTFLRRRGVQTTDGPGLIEGSCPNCGLAIHLNRSAKCSSCDSLLRSGEYDWVLSEITQECEWRDSNASAIPGVAAYRRDKDPGFNVQHLEDRASVVFWRKVMSDRLGDIKPLAKMATADFCQQYAQQLTADEHGRRYRGDCAIGSVDTLGVLRNEPLDLALVEIRWAGKVFAARPGQQPRPDGHSAIFRHLFVFGRKSGVTSDVSRSVSSAHCPSCGAPEEGSLAHACDFCGEVLNDGSLDWVLLDVLPKYDSRAQDLVGQLRQQQPAAGSVIGLESTSGNGRSPQAAELLAWAIKMALADNHLDDKEQAMLRRVAKHRHVSPAQLETLIEAARQNAMDVAEPSDMKDGRRWMEALADVSLCDGQVHRDEYQLLCQVGAKYEMSSYDVKLMLKRRRAELVQTARRRIRNGKSQQA